MHNNKTFNPLAKLGLLVSITLLYSCSTTTEVDYMLISGQIDNTESSYVTVKGPDFSIDIDMNEDGSFSDTIRAPRGHYRFFSGRERTGIFLDNGYDLNIKIDQSEFDETLKFEGEGKGSDLNNYLADKARSEEELMIDFQTLFSMEEEEFSKSMKNISAGVKEIFDASKISDQSFIALEEKNLQYDYLVQFANYEYYHRYATKDESFKVSDEFKENLSGIDFNNEEDFKSLSSYQTLLRSYFGNMIENGDVENAFNGIKAISSSHIRSEIVPGLSYKVQPGNEYSEQIYNGIISVSTDTTIISKLTDKIEKIRKLQVGMESAKFSYSSIDGNTVSLDDLNGKYVYVDVWATWCGPCLREIPALKQLEGDFHDKDIEFVSISIDSEKDFEKWQKMVAEKDLKGVQLFADNSWSSDFVTAYAIDGIPRFILIDPNGNIVDPNAPRPSDPAIREIIEKI